MREALASIRTDLGPEAVMLSSRKVATGVEVIAAIDYDDTLLAGMTADTGGGRARAGVACAGRCGGLGACCSGSGSSRGRRPVRRARDQGFAALARDAARESRLE
jgi:flagellar biosynthesis GTPase FlhF